MVRSFFLQDLRLVVQSCCKICTSAYPRAVDLVFLSHLIIAAERDQLKTKRLLCQSLKSYIRTSGNIIVDGLVKSGHGWHSDAHCTS